MTHSISIKLCHTHDIIFDFVHNFVIIIQLVLIDQYFIQLITSLNNQSLTDNLLFKDCS
jgi:hypothetical protein